VALSAQEELKKIRPDLDGHQIMTILGLPSGREVGRAYQYLLDLRMEHGPLGPERATQELRHWAEAEGLGSPPDPAGSG
jgi:poly(A) polymerase